MPTKKQLTEEVERLEYELFRQNKIHMEIINQFAEKIQHAQEQTNSIISNENYNLKFELQNTKFEMQKKYDELQNRYNKKCENDEW